MFCFYNISHNTCQWHVAQIYAHYIETESICACRSTRVLCILIVFLFFMIIIHIVFKSTGFGVKLFESQFDNLQTIWLWVIQLLCALVFIYKRNTIGAPGWRSRLSVRLQPGHDLAVWEFQPRVGLWADGSEPGACFRFCVSLSLCPSPVHALSLAVPKINKRWKKKKKEIQ